MIPQWKHSHWFIVVIVFFTCFINFNSHSRAQTPSQDGHQLVYFARWEGSILSWHQQGLACWLLDSDGNIRFELMLTDRESPTDLEKIFNWDGEKGWTVISAESGDGTFSRWNEQWQELPSAMEIWLRVIISETSEGLPMPDHVKDISPGGRSLLLPHFAGSEEMHRVKRIQLPQLNQDNFIVHGPKDGLRSLMTRRGRGRGGQEAVLNLIGSADNLGGIRITSSHQPGSLQLGSLRKIAATYENDEVFLPWWPLVETVSLKY